MHFPFAKPVRAAQVIRILQRTEDGKGWTRGIIRDIKWTSQTPLLFLAVQGHKLPLLFSYGIEPSPGLDPGLETTRQDLGLHIKSLTASLVGPPLSPFRSCCRYPFLTV